MNNTAYILAGWLAVFVGVGTYAVAMLVRGRKLSARLPAERRRWSTTPAQRPQP